MSLTWHLDPVRQSSTDPDRFCMDLYRDNHPVAWVFKSGRCFILNVPAALPQEVIDGGLETMMRYIETLVRLEGV